MKLFTHHLKVLWLELEMREIAFYDPLPLNCSLPFPFLLVQT